MKYVKPEVKTFTNDELSEVIMANACTTYQNNCSCGGNHCPCNQSTGPSKSDKN